MKTPGHDTYADHPGRSESELRTQLQKVQAELDDMRRDRDYYRALWLGVVNCNNGQ